MYVTYSGWSEAKGSFNYSIFIDETKADYEIQYENGFVSKQTSPFDTHTYDWNHDGEVYPLFGAWFESKYGGSDFYTPAELVNALIDSLEGEDMDYGSRITKIKGLELPEVLQQIYNTTPVNKRKGR